MHTRIWMAVFLILSGCSGGRIALPTFTPYRIDIQQGNYVTQDMIAKVKPGMSPSQVRFALGTPLIVDPFHNDRWDYVYLYNKAGTVTEQRRIIIVFKDDRLVRIEGDVVAAPAKPAASGAGPRNATGGAK